MDTLNDTDLYPSTSTDDATGAPSEVTPKPEATPRPRRSEHEGSEGDEHSYEEGWYQVLKRRADESADDED
jgi:hypothetical protein